MLTGESLPAQKTVAPIAEPNLPPGDQRNMAFLGTVVVNGRGRGVVVATGAPLRPRQHRPRDAGSGNGAGAAPGEVPPLLGDDRATWCWRRRASSSASGSLVGESLKDMFMTAVAAAVATIPEGLPVVLTIALAAGRAAHGARGTPSSGNCRPSRPSAARRSSAPTRPARSRRTR